MNSLKNELYWEQVNHIASEAMRLSKEWLLPHNINDVELLHRLGDDKEKVVNSFSILELAMLKTAEAHGISETYVTADIWNLMTAEDEELECVIN